jgi:hypothetical protein
VLKIQFRIFPVKPYAVGIVVEDDAAATKSFGGQSFADRMIFLEENDQLCVSGWRAEHQVVNGLVFKHALEDRGWNELERIWHCRNSPQTG